MNARSRRRLQRRHMLFGMIATTATMAVGVLWMYRSAPPQYFTLTYQNSAVYAVKSDRVIAVAPVAGNSHKSPSVLSTVAGPAPVSAVPEPSSLCLLAPALLLLRRRRDCRGV